MTPPSEPLYRLIPLTKGQSAIVDLIDYDWLTQWNWYAYWNKNTHSFYACRTSPRGYGKRYTIFMHREILGLKFDCSTKGDHIETGRTLDNRRLNLRPSSNRQQQCNRRKQSNNTSGYKGVSFHKKTKKWRSDINLENKRVCLGLFDTPELAYASYCAAAIKYYGEFARLA